MTIEAGNRKSLRLWPGIAAVLLLVFFRLVLPAAAPDTAPIGVVSGPVLAIAIVVWLFFSRAPWLDRAAAVAMMIFAVVATRVIVHPSIRSGMMGMITELSRYPAFDAKTWNHPVLVRDVLLVRNGEQMAAYRLSPAAH